MIKHFLSLEWKQYFRSSYWQKSIAINALMVFLAIYLIGILLVIGSFLFKALQKILPDNDPFLVLNGVLFYWIIGDILMRFFLQKLPVMSVKPLLTLPIKRSAVIHFVLGKSGLSFFNFLPLFAFVPFSISLLRRGYEASTVITWLFAIIVVALIINFLNFIIEALSSKTEISFLPVIVLVGGLYALDFFGIVSMTDSVKEAFLNIANTPVLLLIPVSILGICYGFNFKILKEKLFLDASLQSKVKEVKVADLSWTKRFGDIAPFMQLDLKLIWRNKRTKSMTFLLIIGVLYGLFFYPQPTYREMEFMFAFIGIFSTGFFLINFGQFIPAWDSAYYKMLMSQNIKYEQYLRSKFILMVMSVVILFILGIPYVYFGWKILLAHFAAAIYNIGVNSHVIMWGGSYNRKKIELDKKAAFNYQGTGAVQWLIGIPLMLLPMGLFAIINWLLGFEIAIATLIILGIIGIMLHKKLMEFITQKYLNSKYKMINAFGQDT